MTEPRTSEVETLSCAQCGAPLEPDGAPTVRCVYCGTVATVERRGTALLVADFSKPGIAGWFRHPNVPLKLVPGEPPELHASAEASTVERFALTSAGGFEDCDVRVSMRFPDLDPSARRSRALLHLRGSKAGQLYLEHGPGGQLAAFALVGDQKTTLFGLCVHPSLKTDPRAWNHFRFVVSGPKARLYANGVQVTTVAVPPLPAGKVILGLIPGDRPLTAAFASLSLHEPEVSPSPSPAAEPAAAAAPEERWAVVLDRLGSNKIQAIMVVREYTARGLADTKNLVERSPPVTLAEGLSTEKSAAFLRALESAGVVAHRVPRRA